MRWTALVGDLKRLRDIWNHVMESHPEVHEHFASKASWARVNPNSEPHDMIISSTSFNLPLESDLLYLISRGALSFGSVQIEHQPSDLEGCEDQVRVEIEVHTRGEDTLDYADVCLLHPSEGKYGISISTPQYGLPRGGHSEIVFNVKVRLPRSDDDSPIQVKHFDADVPLFSISSDNIVSSAFFSVLTLKSANSPITLNGVTAEHAMLQTSNAPIRGVYSVTKNLELYTSNAPISVVANLSNAPGTNSTRATLQTSNAFIDSNVNLVSKAYDGLGGSYLVDASTSNGSLKLASPTFAPDGSLHLSANTSNSPILVVLNEAFEGTFNVHTSGMFNSSVTIPPEVDGHYRLRDPKSEGRTREEHIVEQTNGNTKGWVRWSGEPTQGPPPGSGEVYLSTSNSNAELIC